jgi:hypothetical protein
MNNKQVSQANMFKNISLFFNKYQPTLSVFAPLWLIIKQFFDKMNDLDAMLQQQQTETKGETKNKQMLLQLMSDALLPLARKARVWAAQQQNLQLEELFNVTETDFFIASLATVTLARNILAGLNANAAALLSFNITAAQLTDAGTAIDSLEASLSLTAQAQNVAKSGTQGLVQVINSITSFLHDCDDLLISEFSASQPVMVSEYKNNRFIGNSVSRHTTLTVHVYSDAAKTQPVAGATITLTKYNLSATTDFEGTGVIEKFRGGELSATLSAVGYADSNISFTIKNGQHIDMDAVMAATVPVKE